jgi:hypothetical protein
MRSTDSRGFSSLWLPCLLVFCTIVTLYALEHVKGGLMAYKTYLLSTQWFDDELLTTGISQYEECSTTVQGVRICQFPSRSTLFSESPKNIWIDWETLNSKVTPCVEPCIINEALPPLLVYDKPIELANAYCILPDCMIASSEQIRIHGTVATSGNITLLARSDITISSINIQKNSGALIISSQGTVRVMNPVLEPGITTVSAFPDEQSTLSSLTDTFTSPLIIIEGVRTIRANE